MTLGCERKAFTISTHFTNMNRCAKFSASLCGVCMTAPGALAAAPRELAKRHFARAGFHVAQHAHFIVLAEHVFLGEIAMEVEAVEPELLRGAHLLLGQFGNREHAVQAPEAPRDRTVEPDTPAVETEHCIGANACRAEPAHPERNGVTIMLAVGQPLRHGGAIERRLADIPHLRAWNHERALPEQLAVDSSDEPDVLSTAGYHVSFPVRYFDTESLL